MSEFLTRFEHAVDGPAEDQEDPATRWGHAGSLLMTQSPVVDGCTVCKYIDDPKRPKGEYDIRRPRAGLEWRQCGMPVFGLLDLESPGADLFGVCFRHLIEANESAPFVPIRPLGLAHDV